MKEIILILADIRSSHNVGSILRTADCFGVNQIYFAGYTPYPRFDGDKRLPHLAGKITSAIHKTALGAENSLQVKLFTATSEAVSYAKAKGFLVLSVEQSPDSKPITDFKTPKRKLALILGNEVSGLSRQILDLSDVILEIPIYGKKESLNVVQAAAIALYQLQCF